MRLFLRQEARELAYVKGALKLTEEAIDAISTLKTVRGAFSTAYLMNGVARRRARCRSASGRWSIGSRAPTPRATSPIRQHALRETQQAGLARAEAARQRRVAGSRRRASWRSRRNAGADRDSAAAQPPGQDGARRRRVAGRLAAGARRRRRRRAVRAAKRKVACGGASVGVVNTPAGGGPLAAGLYAAPLELQPGRWYEVGATDYGGPGDPTSGDYGSIPDPGESYLPAHPDTLRRAIGARQQPRATAGRSRSRTPTRLTTSRT